MQLFSIKYLTHNFNETRMNYSLLFVYLFSVFILFYLCFDLLFILYINPPPWVIFHQACCSALWDYLLHGLLYMKSAICVAA